MEVSQSSLNHLFPQRVSTFIAAQLVYSMIIHTMFLYASIGRE